LNQHFEIWMQDDPQALLRVVGLFAQRSLVPEALTAQRADDRLRVTTEVSGIDAGGADILVARLREAVLVIDAARHEAAAPIAHQPSLRCKAFIAPTKFDRI
jgi:acetolactate synthase small subunit